MGRVKSGKALGPDGVLPEIVAPALREQRQVFLEIANIALGDGRFPDRIKQDRLVLVSKPVKNTGDDIKYCPISLINVFAKVLEAMIERRLREHRSWRRTPR